MSIYIYMCVCVYISTLVCTYMFYRQESPTGIAALTTSPSHP